MDVETYNRYERMDDWQAPRIRKVRKRKRKMK